MSTVLLLTGSALSNNPRAWKEANALAGAGHDVEVLGAWLDGEAKSRDQQLLQGTRVRFTPVLDGEARGWRTRFAFRLARLVHRAGKLAFRVAGIENRLQLGITEWPLHRAALRRCPDLAIAHSEYAMPVALKLARRGQAVALDLEDWFSHDLPESATKLRPGRLLESLERALLHEGVYASCPSDAMSRAVARACACRAPLVIYNAFAWTDRRSIDGRKRDRADRTLPSIHWYSQTLGPWRGLEDLFAALALMRTPVEVHLRGQGTPRTRQWIDSLVPESCRPRVHVHPTVASGELLSRIAEHDIGFAGEMPFCESRDTTVTNKILQYMQAGLAVVASATQGQREVARHSGAAVRLYPSGDPQALARVLDELLASPELLAAAKRDSLDAAQHIFCWERQEPVLLQAVEAAVRSRQPLREESPA